MSGRGRAREEVSAGGVVFRWVEDGDGARRPFFLLIRDSYRNWGFPKGHLEDGEGPDAAAVREVMEETGLGELALEGAIETIDWYFRFRGRLVHKVCHFYLMRTARTDTCPQRSEGITACRWAPFDEAVTLVSYANAREVLRRAHAMLEALPQALPTAIAEARREPPSEARADVLADALADARPARDHTPGALPDRLAGNPAGSTAR